MKQPDPKKHQIISFAKSGIRILACLSGMSGNIVFAFAGLAIAEVVGIWEELV
jgi:hypothetical protein